MRRRAVILAGAVMFCAALWTAAQQGDIEAQNAVKRASEERLAEIERQSRQIEGTITVSERSLQVARGTIAAKRKVAADLERETRRIATEIEADARRARELDERLAELRQDYGRAVYTAWKNHKTGTATTMLLASRDFNDATRRINFIRRYNRAREQQGAQIEETTHVLEAEIEALGAKKTETEQLRAQENTVLASLAVDEASYAATIASLASDRSRLAAEARREREKIAAAQRQIEQIMERQARAARQSAMTEADIALTGQFGDNKGRLPWPTGAPGLILHHFGKERSSDGIESDFKGLIIAARPGSEVRAVFEGTVTLIADLGQFDRCVMVRSGEYVVGYGNIAAPEVRSGQKITTGQVIGRVNDSDNAERHLVMVWMQQGDTVLDPEQWLR